MKLVWLSLSVLAACAVEPAAPEIDDPFPDKSAWEPASPFSLEACHAASADDLAEYMVGQTDRALGTVSFRGRERTGKTDTCTDASCYDWKPTLTPTLWLASAMGDVPAHSPVIIDEAPGATLVQSAGTFSIRFTWPAQSVEAFCTGSPSNSALQCTLAQRIEANRSELMFPTRPDDVEAPTEAKLTGHICDDGRYHLATDDWYGPLAASGRVGLALWGRI